MKNLHAPTRSSLDHEALLLDAHARHLRLNTWPGSSTRRELERAPPLPPTDFEDVYANPGWQTLALGLRWYTLDEAVEYLEEMLRIERPGITLKAMLEGDMQDAITYLVLCLAYHGLQPIAVCSIPYYSLALDEPYFERGAGPIGELFRRSMEQRTTGAAAAGQRTGQEQQQQRSNAVGESAVRAGQAAVKAGPGTGGGERREEQPEADGQGEAEKPEAKPTATARKGVKRCTTAHHLSDCPGRPVVTRRLPSVGRLANMGELLIYWYTAHKRPRLSPAQTTEVRMHINLAVKYLSSAFRMSGKEGHAWLPDETKQERAARMGGAGTAQAQGGTQQATAVDDGAGDEGWIVAGRTGRAGCRKSVGETAASLGPDGRQAR